MAVYHLPNAPVNDFDGVILYPRSIFWVETKKTPLRLRNTVASARPTV